MNRTVVLTIVVALAISAPLVAEEPDATGPPGRAAARPGAPQVLTPQPAPPAVHRALARAIEAPTAGAKALPPPPNGSWGIVSSGSGGGAIFRDSDSEAEAWLGTDGAGIRGYGSEVGGYFKDSTNTGFASVGCGDFGIEGYGSEAGGYFEDPDGSGVAWTAYDRSPGTDKGGYDNDGEYGVYAAGSKAGGYFEDADHSGYAYVGYGNRGIVAYGSDGGGRFEDSDGSGWATVGPGSYKILGSGTVSFVQNHPHDPSAVVVYAAPEGDEVATYTRGTARLEGGEARVPLGETFRWVTNPDIGLTAHVTPRGDCNGMYVSLLTTEEVVVRELHGGTSDCTFDYLVYGLRIGFEESTVVQEKREQAYIPSMKDHRELAARRPDMAMHTALARWTGQAKALGREEPLDLRRAHALRDLIGEYDPAVHGLIQPPRLEAGQAAAPGEESLDEPPAPLREGARARVATEDAEHAGEVGLPAQAGAARDVYARSFRPAAADLASLLDVSEAVEPGDVVAVDPERPGALRRALSASDPTVVGVVAAEPGVVLGSGAGGGGGRAAVTFAGIATCKVDAAYGPIFPGDLLVSSPTAGHAMRTDVASPGTVLGKALEELTDGAAPIRILVMPR